MLSRSECFKVLGLDESAGPNAIKRAYRKLAFELHPDLNPNVPDASKRFQELNEAYVTLMQEYANTSFAAGGRRGSGSGGRAQGGTTGGAADDKTREEARKAYAKASKDFNAGSSQSGASGASSATSGSPGSSGAGASSAGQAGFGGATGATGTGGYGGSGGFSSGASYGTTGGTGGGGFGGSPRPPGGTRAPGQEPGKEEILRDLLNDPFARRVFEDIYSTVRYNTGKGAKTSAGQPARPAKRPVKVRATPKKSTLSKAGDKMIGLAGGITGGIKGWLRKQIDDEQTMFLPGESLVPGARVRLQVQHGFSGDKRTIEFTLPPEFVPGKPIRLKGLGRRIGGMQGDLYLRVFRSED